MFQRQDSHMKLLEKKIMNRSQENIGQYIVATHYNVLIVAGTHLYLKQQECEQ